MDKQSVLAHLAGARAALLAAIEDLSEAEIATLPVAGVWTIRDILAHVSGWAAWDLAGIRSILTGERPDFSAIQDVDTFNSRLVAARSVWPLAQILAEMGDTQTALQELLAALPDEDLSRVGPFRGPYWDNLVGWLQVAWEHEEEHTAQIRTWRAGSISLKISLVNGYLAHKQHLLPVSHLTDVVQVTRDIVALHATDATGPYLSLLARVPDFQRQELEDALYERRELTRVHCMRMTVHAVPSDEVPFFFQAYVERHTQTEFRGWEPLLVQAGLCQKGEAEALLKKLHRRVLDVLTEKGPSTVREISQAVPDLRTKIQHSVGKSYEGEFSIGSRLMLTMSMQGLLVRARPRGSWRSNLYEYAALSDWLSGVDLESVTPQEARAWLVQRYLAAFGPATLDDIQWWTGFSKGEAEEALGALKPAVMEVVIEGLGDGYLMLADDAQRLRDFALPDTPYIFFLPGLDPYIMGYQDRRRFLAAEHHAKVFDRAGNAIPTVWVNGRVVGAWGQRKDGNVVYGLFEPVGEEERALLDGEVQRLEDFLDGEFLPPRTSTPFTRTLK